MPTPIPGTALFGGAQARKGYALNRMCFSFNEAFLRDEPGSCARYGVIPDQREAVAARNVLAMIAAGGNVYYLPRGRHLRPGRAGHRRAADRHDQGGFQGEAGRGREGLTMARILGGIMTSHVPAIGRAIARNLRGDPYFKPWFDGFPPVHHWLAEVKPDVAVVVYNDPGLNFFLDKMPTFAVAVAVGAAPEYRPADEGWGLPVVPPFRGDVDLSWHLIEALVRDEFDITTCQEMRVDHAFTLPMALLWRGQGAWPVRTVPVCIYTVQFPRPGAARCWKLGEAIGRAIEGWNRDAKVVLIGSGGGCRTSSMVNVPASSTRMSTSVSWTTGSAIRKGRPATPARNWSRGRAPRASNC